MTPRIIEDITRFIFVSDTPKEADILFLPGGSFPEIPEKAAKLYHEGYVRLLLPSGGVSVKLGKFSGVKSKAEIYNKAYETDCDFYTDVLIKNQVPSRAIITENQSGHTRDNAFLSRRATDQKGLDIKSALIVCKSFHARRCLMLYQLAFPEAEIHVCPVDIMNISRDTWHTHEYGIDRVLGELARCGNQFTGDIKEYLKRG